MLWWWDKVILTNKIIFEYTYKLYQLWYLLNLNMLASVQSNFVKFTVWYVSFFDDVQK